MDASTSGCWPNFPPIRARRSIEGRPHFQVRIGLGAGTGLRRRAGLRQEIVLQKVGDRLADLLRLARLQGRVRAHDDAPR